MDLGLIATDLGQEVTRISSLLAKVNLGEPVQPCLLWTYECHGMPVPGSSSLESFPTVPTLFYISPGPRKLSRGLVLGLQVWRDALGLNGYCNSGSGEAK